MRFGRWATVGLVGGGGGGAIYVVGEAKPRHCLQCRSGGRDIVYNDAVDASPRRLCMYHVPLFSLIMLDCGRRVGARRAVFSFEWLFIQCLLG